MTEGRLETEGDGVVHLSGAMDFASVPDLWRRGGVLFRQGRPLTIDLAGVTRADSAGLALLVGWSREAARAGVSVVIRNPPNQLRDIARVSGLDHLLG